MLGYTYERIYGKLLTVRKTRMSVNAATPIYAHRFRFITYVIDFSVDTGFVAGQCRTIQVREAEIRHQCGRCPEHEKAPVSSHDSKELGH
jgi:hypothetical protein